MSDLRLRNGDRVIIVGGGPAGSLAALHLLRLAREERLELRVEIYEPRDYFTPGATRNCKGCAGILSAGALRHLAELGLTVPSDVIQSELRVYEIHVAGHVSVVEQPVPERRILSVYRGSGPRRHRGPPLVSFDGFLLSHAMAAGACLISARVRKVSWDGRPVVHTDDDSQPADLLVLATGVNSRSPLDPSFGYQPPGSAVMVQDEIRRPEGWPEDRVAGFFGQPRELLFGALVPKGEYLNVSLLWQGKPSEALGKFYAAQARTLRERLPSNPESVCGCNPRILRSPALHYYGDRWVCVGDAAISHLYKDGINSAFLTAREAMTSAVTLGVGTEEFRRGYKPLCDRLAADNRYGSVLYSATSLILRHERLVRGFGALVRNESSSGATRRVHSRLLWGMLTGDEPYRDLFRLALAPAGLLAFLRQVARG